jgi:toluene monooxygenase system ferredoxin subunit
MSAALAVPVLDVEKFLSRVGFFDGFSDEQRARIASVSNLVHFRMGEQVYEIRDPANIFYVLVDGTILFSLAVGQRQATAGQVIGHGEVFGWAALVAPGQPRKGSASAMSACTALAIDGAALVAMADADHSFGYLLMRAVNKIITGTLTAFVAG